MFRCPDGKAYEAVYMPGEGGQRLVEASDAEVRAWKATHGREDVPSVSLSLDEVKGCFEGPLLPRARRIAALGPARFLVLFGQARRSDRYVYAANLRRIGGAIPAPTPGETCGRPVRCTEAVGACEACGRRIVSETLDGAGYLILLAAAKHADPVEQLRAAARARTAEAMRPRKRRASLRRTHTAERE